jgi:hypothetical protein
VDGEFLLRDDEDYVVADNSGYLEESTKAKRFWTRVTSFWPEDVKPTAHVLLEATYLPRQKTELLEIMAGGDINRDSVPICDLSAIGLETEVVINAQKVCPEIGLIYHAVTARNSNLPIGQHLLKIKTAIPELWAKGQKLPLPLSVRYIIMKSRIKDYCVVGSTMSLMGNCS